MRDHEAQPNIVLLPGLDGTGILLEELASKLAENFDVTVITYPMDASLGYKELTALVRAQLPDKPFILLGESFSGPIAIELAVQEKERMAGLVLAATFAKAPKPRFLTPLISLYHSALAPAWLSRALLLSGFGDNVLSRKLQTVLTSLPDAVVRKRLREVMAVDKTEFLHQIECPTLYLSGKKDRLIGAKPAELIQNKVPNCQAQTLDAPHMLLATRVDVRA